MRAETVWYREATNVMAILSGSKFEAVDPNTDAVFEGEFEDDFDVQAFLLEQGYVLIGEL